MPKPGTINEQWGRTEEMSKTTSWERSFEQTFSTRFGQEFTLTALMERVWVDDEGNVVKRIAMPDEVVRASELTDDLELAQHALAIQEHLTAMLGIKLQRKALLNGDATTAQD